MPSETQRVHCDAELRRATLAQLADYLQTQRDAVSEQWLLAVRRDPNIESSDRLTHRQLVDHLPRIYQECCEFLRCRDVAVLAGEAKDDARDHGGIRWQDGYQIDELLRELEAYRRIIAATATRYGEHNPVFKASIESSAQALIHQFFGEVTVNSVRQFVAQQQQLVGEHTRKLESTNLALGRSNTNLRQALSERHRLTSVVAHELRNFLQGLGYAKKLWDRTTDSGSSQLQTLAQINDMEALLAQLVQHSALTRNNEPLDVAEFDPCELHQEIVRAYQPAARQKHLQFVAECQDLPANLRSDRARIKQVAVNLLSNAVKFTAAGEIGLVFAAHDASRWVIRVSDSGLGLAADTAERLFGTLGAVAVPEDPPGRGASLAITRDLVELLGGSLQVVTRTGAGTRIDVLLPRDYRRNPDPARREFVSSNSPHPPDTAPDET